VHRAVGNLKPPYDILTAQYVLLHAVYRLLDQRGRQRRWLYNVAAVLRRQLSDVLLDIARNYQNQQDVLDRLRVQHQPALERFRQGYIHQTTQDVGPFVGCTYCRVCCRYRWEVAPLVRDAGLERDFLDAIRKPQGDADMWAALADICREVASRTVCVSASQVNEDVALCFAAQMGAAQRFTSATQAKLTRNVHQMLTCPVV